ncbi:hypothetical protein MNEG_13124 [Monoraphidium neglectum]|uniref:Uncharacterized protein n=1 Tax=Monoraphidium neglectum TaxID=145388 RepID=A0A0D2KG42_9CHLO|nr:hypothetical protein MNEG_13124 [Monoraphidium neglectum]KIY94838.1 hypothetical protein MNEG_13124 [Monoraphidium neglectum]|eukprot:XP_013893858.1 hypothetical protein MNEG_13124 [Monoraphidium neglectum]
MLNKEGKLAFVVCRVTTYPAGSYALPIAVQSRFEEITLTQAQQFRGYAFALDSVTSREGRIALAFTETMDALRFCHSAQTLYMFSSWPPEAHEYFGLSVPSADGTWVFQGPRVAMAIHDDASFHAAQLNSLKGILSPQDSVRIGGAAVDFTAKLASIARGGQVMLSQAAWESVKPIITQHPGAAQVISLGTHVISDEYPNPCLLMEVMPNTLSRRVFKKPITCKMLELGYRDAPDLGAPMAIVFCKVHKPEDVTAAEKPEGHQDPQLIGLYQSCVPIYTSLARRLLIEYEGYECKEPEPGKFTLAFKVAGDASQGWLFVRTMPAAAPDPAPANARAAGRGKPLLACGVRRLDNAIQWACRLQIELVHARWPTELLGMRDCAPISGTYGEPVFRGLRVRIGIAWGCAVAPRPLMI